MSTTFASTFTMNDIQPQLTNLDYLNAPLDFENGFGFSPATSPARDQSKQDFGGYFSNAMDDLLDPPEGDFFNSYAQPSSLQSLPSSGFASVNSKVVHGQVTPPSDNSPVTPKREPLKEPTPVSLDDHASEPQPPRKKRETQSRQSISSASSSQSAARRRKSSIRKQSFDSSSGEKDEKRSKFLERNRVAASKCRQKKKEWTANLEQRARDLQQNKTHLTLLVNSLRDEVLYLKGEVLKHDTCNCTALRNYMSRSVSQLSGEPINPKLQLSTNPTPVSDLDLDGMSFSGSPDLTATASPSASMSTP